MKKILTIIILIWTNLLFSQVIDTLKWTFETDVDIKYTPAIADDGTIYVGGGNLYALNSDGTLKWKYSPYIGDYKVSVSGSPVLAADGTIYFSDQYHGVFYAVNPDGTEKWNRDITEGNIDGSPAIDANGTIIIATSAGELIALNPDNGSEKWKKYRGTSHFSAPAIDANGTIFFHAKSGTSNYLKAINSAGYELWSVKIGKADDADSSPAIGADGTVYVGSNDKYIYAINPDGATKWHLELNGKIASSAVIDADGTIYIFSKGSVFYAINPDGTVKWKFDKIDSYASGFTLSGTVGSDSLIYIGGYVSGGNYRLFAINPDNGTVNWDFNLDIIPDTSPTITQDGNILVAATHELYAIHSNCSGLADSPWPLFRKNCKNTGLSPVTVVSVEEFTVNGPQKYSLSDAYPNPFNPTANFNFSIKKSETVNISVYNTLGQMVQNLVNEYKNAGSYHVSWNAANFGSGIYFIKINSGSFTQTKKVILLK